MLFLTLPDEVVDICGAADIFGTTIAVSVAFRLYSLSIETAFFGLNYVIMRSITFPLYSAALFLTCIELRSNGLCECIK